MTDVSTEVRTAVAAPPERVITAMITPFDESGEFNAEGAQHLASYLVEHGSDGLVLSGTTGESPTLEDYEQQLLFRVVREAVGDNVLLIGGTGSNDTNEAVQRTRKADEDGFLNGILAVSPYYNRPSQYGLEDYFRQIARATDLPVTLYNIPVRTGRLVEQETVRRLAHGGDIKSVKDATGSVDMARALAKEFGSDLTIFSGDDVRNLEYLESGAVGAISVASHWTGREMSRMFEAFFTGDMAKALRINELLRPSYNFESNHEDAWGSSHDTPNPVPTKIMMAQILGYSTIGSCRPPMMVAPEEGAYLARAATGIRQELEAAAAWL